MKTIALIQARLGSSRLPLKSLLYFREMPLIDWVITRVARARHIQQVIVAIPDTDLDTLLAEHLQRKGVAVYRGSEHDVLARFYGAACMAQATHIVRVCADNPLIWAPALDALCDFYAHTACDYAYNHIPRNNRWPDGLGAEMLSLSLLEELHHKATLPVHREHCLSYIWDNASTYRIATFDPANPLLCRPDIKLDIDTREDFYHLARLPLHVHMDAEEIIALLDAHATRTP